MKKEALKLSNITGDLKKMADFYMSNRVEVRLGFAVPIVIFAVVLGVLTRRVWVGLLIFSFASIDIVRFVKDLRAYRNTKQLIMTAIERGDISVSVETLSHIAQEMIYEPHTLSAGGEAYRHAMKMITVFYFEGGGSWRLPDVATHYAWSPDYYLSPMGLLNTSTQARSFSLFVCKDITILHTYTPASFSSLACWRQDARRAREGIHDKKRICTADALFAYSETKRVCYR